MCGTLPSTKPHNSSPISGFNFFLTIWRIIYWDNLCDVLLVSNISHLDTYAGIGVDAQQKKDSSESWPIAYRRGAKGGGSGIKWISIAMWATNQKVCIGRQLMNYGWGSGSIQNEFHMSWPWAYTCLFTLLGMIKMGSPPSPTPGVNFHRSV